MLDSLARSDLASEISHRASRRNRARTAGLVHAESAAHPESARFCPRDVTPDQLFAALQAVTAGFWCCILPKSRPPRTAAATPASQSLSRTRRTINPARTRSPANARRGPRQQRNRRATQHFRSHRKIPRRFDPRQTRRRQPHRSRGPRHPPRPCPSLTSRLGSAVVASWLRPILQSLLGAQGCCALSPGVSNATHGLPVFLPAARMIN